MMKRKAIIPVAAVMALSSGITVFADEQASKENIEQDYKEIIYKKATVTPKKGLNVRNTPEVSGNNKLFAVTKGTEFDLLGKTGDWYKINLNQDKSAWINSNYVEVSNKNLYVSADRVNFREGAGLESKVYEVLDKNTELEFIEDNNEWIKIKYDNKEGYINHKYVTDEKPVVNLENDQVLQNTNNKDDKNSGSSAKVTDSHEKIDIKNSVTVDNDQNVENKGNDIEENSKNTDQIANNKNKNNNNRVEEKVSTEDKNKINESKSENFEHKNSEVDSKNTINNTEKKSNIVQLAYAQLGKPYIWGSEGPNSFDCSGLMSYLYKNGSGINLPRTSKQQSGVGTTIARSDLQPGDLIFSSTDGSGKVSHVGVYVGNGEMIHAPTSGDVVKKTSINSSYWNNTYLWSKRVS